MKLFSKTIIALTITFLFPKHINGQIDSTANQIDSTKLNTIQKTTSGLIASIDIELPSITKPSPEATAITRYGDYPVGHSTGVPDISLPLYEIQLGDLKLPISIKNHPSGRRPEELEGILGYGWTLDCGGIVTRTKRGIRDDLKNIPFLPKSLIKNNCFIPNDDQTYNNQEKYNYNLLEGITNYSTEKRSIERIDNYDSQYDIFNFVLPTGSGKFILKDSTVGGVKTKVPVTIPYKPIDVKIIFGSVFIDQIIITDMSGIQYFFGLTIDKKNKYTEYVSKYSDVSIINSDDLPQPQISDEPGVAFPLSNYYITAWNMTAIVSANKADTIKFDYGNPKVYLKRDGGSALSTSVTIADMLIYDTYLTQDQRNGFPYNYDKKLIYTFSDETYSSCRLKEITCKKCSIVVFVDNEHKIMRNLKIYNHLDNQFKNIDFSYSKPSGEINLFLDSINISGIDKAIVEKYSFTYYPGLFLNSSYNTQNNNISTNYVYRKDWWGYYNNWKGIYNEWTVPSFSIDLKHVMESIAYNTYTDARKLNIQSNGIVNRDVDEDACKSGMIKSITYPTGGTTTFYYESNYYNYYGQTYKGPGLRVQRIENKSLNGKTKNKIYQYTVGYLPKELHPLLENFMIENRERVLLSNCHLISGQSSHWCFLDYLDYRTRTFNSEFVLETTGLTPTNVLYTSVTELISPDFNPENSISKTVYTYYPVERNCIYYKYNKNYAVSRQENYIASNKLKFLSDITCWKGGQIESKIEYKISDKISSWVKKTDYFYNDYYKESLKELCAIKYFNFCDYTSDNAHYYYSTDFQREMGEATFCYAHKDYISGVELLTRVITTEKTDNGIIESVNSYDYEPTHFQLSKETVYDSKAVFNLDEKEFSDNRSNIVTEYTYPFQLNENPYTEMTKLNILTPIIETSKHKNNNIFMQKSRTNYNKWSDYLFAPQNIQTQSQRQTDFETRIKFGGYNEYGNPISISRDDADKLVYLWSYNGLYLIAEIKNATYQQVEKELGNNYISNLAANTNPTESDLSKLNALRLSTNLPDIEVTTFTYKPLVGLQTKTDPRGIVTTYKYDNFNRLDNIKDNNGNVIQQYHYHYSKPE